MFFEGFEKDNGYIEPKYVLIKTTEYYLTKDGELDYGHPEFSTDITTDYNDLKENVAYRDKNEQKIDIWNEDSIEPLETEYVEVTEKDLYGTEMTVIKVRFFDRETWLKVRNILEDYSSIYRCFN